MGIRHSVNLIKHEETSAEKHSSKISKISYSYLQRTILNCFSGLPKCRSIKIQHFIGNIFSSSAILLINTGDTVHILRLLLALFLFSVFCPCVYSELQRKISSHLPLLKSKNIKKLAFFLLPPEAAA